MTCTVYYNPECSKCRALLALMEDRAVAARLVDYRRDPLSSDELSRLVAQLGDEAPSLLRRDDPAFVSLGLGPREPDAALIVDALQRFPQLMQRPIVVCGDRALIARPPERVFELL